MVRYRRRYRHDSYRYGYLPYGYDRTITGVVLGAIIGCVVAIIGTLANLLWRYRSELAPFSVAGATVWCGQWAHTYHPGWWRVLAVLTAAVVAALAAFPGRWRRVRWPVLGRGIERAYLAGCLTAGGAWLTVAIKIGPSTSPLPALGVAGTIVCAIPWWEHHRRRAKVRVERTLEGWPDVADASGLTGTRVVSALVDAWGWTARIALPRGQTADQVIAAVPAIESGLGIAPGAARAEPDPHRADRAYLRVLDSDPHANAIGYPRPQPGTASITRPVPLGLWDDGTVTDVLLLRRNALIGGITDSGKSNLLNVVMAYLVACPDVIIWGIDLKGGMELGPWAACLANLATTPQQATNLLKEAVAEIDMRAREQVARGERLREPGYDDPALLIVIDEYAEMPDEAAEYADSVARLGRAVAVNLLAATQRPTQKAMRNNAVRSQMDVRICLRVRERRDVTLILGEGMLAAGWHAHKLDQPGKFLITARGPQYAVPRPARAYLITDTDVASIVSEYGRYHRGAIASNETHPDTPSTESETTRSAVVVIDKTPSPQRLLLDALENAPDEGISVPDLVTATGTNRSWVYRRLNTLAQTGQVTKTRWGRWRIGEATPPDNT
jgi:S-DNA-T family DNA segregation ATPase FtsK/SpoIIIE